MAVVRALELIVFIVLAAVAVHQWRRARRPPADAVRPSFTWDLCTQVVTCGPDIVTMLGCSPTTYDELAAVVHPDDLATVEAATAEILQTWQPIELEHRFVVADGGVRCVHVDVEPVLDPAGHPVRIVGRVRDITEQRRAEEELRASEERFRLLLDGVVDHAIYTLDPDGRIASWNAGAARIEGHEADEVLGRDHSCLYIDEDLASGRPDWLLREAVVRARCQHEGWRVRADGSRFFAHVVIAAIYDAAGCLQGFSNVTRDVTERKDAEAALVHQTLHDALTSLPNRSLLVDRLTQALARQSRQHTGTALLMLDLDRFKWVNDGLGHEVGDEVLVQVARRLESAVRPGDTVARLGGDEFVVLCEAIDERAAVVIAARLVEAVRQPLVLAGRRATVTASVGVATASPGAGLSPDALLRDADTAGHRAKERGRDRVEVFDEGVGARAVERFETERALREALDRGELRVHYQPVLEPRTQDVVAVEALVRWAHPTRGLVPPNDFIPVAEETGLIVPLGMYVLETACDELARWNAAYPHHPPLSVAVNLSARQLMSPALADQVAAVLHRSGLHPRLLCLEITESVLMDDADACRAALERLKALGVRLGVDDFGTGYSSLLYLRRFPVDFLKVDQSFVAGLGRSAEDDAIVAGVIGLAHALGLEAIAEGVEQPEQVASLVGLGCDLAQGYHWSRPLPAADVIAWVDARRRAVTPASR